MEMGQPVPQDPIAPEDAVPLRRRVRASSEGVVVCSLGRGWSSARARRLRARRTEERADPRIYAPERLALFPRTDFVLL